MTYVPLLLAFGKTTHSAQSMSIGPVREGQCKNMLERCVVDIGQPGFEARNPGLMYTAFSRATTIGHPDNLLSSAKYFEGCHMNRERLENVNSRKSQQSEKVKKREAWVQYLDSNEKKLTRRERKDMKKTAKWFRTTRLSPHHVIAKLG